jgi:hypothetical protein
LLPETGHEFPPGDIAIPVLIHTGEPCNQWFRDFIFANGAIPVFIKPVEERLDPLSGIHRRPGIGVVPSPLLGVGCGTCYEQGREKREKHSVLHESASIFVRLQLAIRLFNPPTGRGIRND